MTGDHHHVGGLAQNAVIGDCPVSNSELCARAVALVLAAVEIVHRRLLDFSGDACDDDIAGQLDAGWVVWTTAASAHPWLKLSGLATDARGFVCVGDTLQSVSHPRVFAAGDCASMAHRDLPKSGVYAVRQGPPLAENLRRALAGMPLIRYRPQRRALSLISTGGRHAVASWGGMALSGRWVWRWKDRIDRAFVTRYRIQSTA